MSYVTEFPAAEPQEAVTHFLRRLSVETDCADVHHAITHNEQDFVLLHVVGSPEQFARRHVPGALHMPWSQMTAERMAQWPEGTLFVVYCAGPHCNWPVSGCRSKSCSVGSPAGKMNATRLPARRPSPRCEDEFFSTYVKFSRLPAPVRYDIVFGHLDIQKSKDSNNELSLRAIIAGRLRRLPCNDTTPRTAPT